MSQIQPASLPHYREVAGRVGCYRALTEAARDVDDLKEQLGRRLDLQIVLRGLPFVAGLLFGLFLAWTLACTTIDKSIRPSDWPQLRVIERSVPHSVMRSNCAKYTSAFSTPEACAEVDFKNRICVIWYSRDFPPPAWMVQHEREHCMGFDHVGESALRDAWEEWKRGRK